MRGRTDGWTCVCGADDAAAAAVVDAISSICSHCSKAALIIKSVRWENRNESKAVTMII